MSGPGQVPPLPPPPGPSGARPASPGAAARLRSASNRSLRRHGSSSSLQRQASLRSLKRSASQRSMGASRDLGAPSSSSRPAPVPSLYDQPPPAAAAAAAAAAAPPRPRLRRNVSLLDDTVMLDPESVPYIAPRDQMIVDAQLRARDRLPLRRWVDEEGQQHAEELSLYTTAVEDGIFGVGIGLYFSWLRAMAFVLFFLLTPFALAMLGDYADRSPSEQDSPWVKRISLVNLGNDRAGVVPIVCDFVLCVVALVYILRVNSSQTADVRYIKGGIVTVADYAIRVRHLPRHGLDVTQVRKFFEKWGSVAAVTIVVDAEDLIELKAKRREYILALHRAEARKAHYEGNAIELITNATGILLPRSDHNRDLSRVNPIATETQSMAGTGMLARTESVRSLQSMHSVLPRTASVASLASVASQESLDGTATRRERFMHRIAMTTIQLEDCMAMRKDRPPLYWRRKLRRLDRKIKAVKNSEVVCTGEAYVTFETIKSALRCKKAYQPPRYFAIFGSPPMFGDQYVIKAKDAPEPADIEWRNLGIGWYSRLGRQILTLVCSLLLIVTGIVTITLLLQVRADTRQEGSDPSSSIGPEQIGVSLAIVGINFLLSALLQKLVHLERHHSQSGYHTGLSLKLFFLQFINSALTIFFASALTDLDVLSFSSSSDTSGSAFWRNLWKRDEVIENYTLILFADAIVPTARVFLLERMQRYRQGYEAKKAVIQYDFERAFDPPVFPLAKHYANSLKTIFLAMFYAPVIPIGIPLAWLTLLAQYFIYKYNFLRLQQAVRFSEATALHVLKVVPYCVLAHLFVASVAFGTQGIEWEGSLLEHFSDGYFFRSAPWDTMSADRNGDDWSDADYALMFVIAMCVLMFLWLILIPVALLPISWIWTVLRYCCLSGALHLSTVNKVSSDLPNYSDAIGLERYISPVRDVLQWTHDGDDRHDSDHASSANSSTLRSPRSDTNLSVGSSQSGRRKGKGARKMQRSESERLPRNTSQKSLKGSKSQNLVDISSRPAVRARRTRPRGDSDSSDSDDYRPIVRRQRPTEDDSDADVGRSRGGNRRTNQRRRRQQRRRRPSTSDSGSDESVRSTGSDAERRRRHRERQLQDSSSDEDRGVVVAPPVDDQDNDGEGADDDDADSEVLSLGDSDDARGTGL